MYKLIIWIERELQRIGGGLQSHVLANGIGIALAFSSILTTDLFKAIKQLHQSGIALFDSVQVILCRRTGSCHCGQCTCYEGRRGGEEKGESNHGCGLFVCVILEKKVLGGVSSKGISACDCDAVASSSEDAMAGGN